MESGTRPRFRGSVKFLPSQCHRTLAQGKTTESKTQSPTQCSTFLTCSLSISLHTSRDRYLTTQEGSPFHFGFLYCYQLKFVYCDFQLIQGLHMEYLQNSFFQMTFSIFKRKNQVSFCLPKYPLGSQFPRHSHLDTLHFMKRVLKRGQSIGFGVK